MITRCPLCESDAFVVFLERTGVPVHQNIPLETRAAAHAVQRGDLRLACCSRCGFITNLAFREELLQYGEGYENDQTTSPRFDAHVEGLLQRLLDDGVRNKFVVEVGCGRGYFLRRLCERGQNRGIGFDPSYRGPDTIDDGRIRFVREFYGAKHAETVADVVICRHVIEHVPSPLDLLAAVRAGLGTTAYADLAFETPTVEWILDGVVIEDFFYEHCSYFSAESLGFAFRRAGFQPRAVDAVFGGQYLWINAAYEGARQAAAAPLPPSARRLLALAAKYRERVAERISHCRARLGAMRSSGPTAVWGAGAKGVTFLHLLDADATLVDCVVDINPRKQGKYVPGTGHPIVPVEELRARGIRHVVIMNPNYSDEIRATVSCLGFNITIHDDGGWSRSA